MSLPFKPMLSASLDGVPLDTLRYPLLASPKLDGIRCLIWEGVAYSRNAKPIRNHFVQAWASNYHGLDGELIVGSPTEGLVLERTKSGVTRYDGEPDFTYHIFDSTRDLEGLENFQDRYDTLNYQLPDDERLVVVPHIYVSSPRQLERDEAVWLAEGYEGVMLRDPKGPYKHGRSTLKEGYLMKLKRFQDGEAVVLRVEEGMENRNEQTRDELGRAKRSTHKENMVPSGMVGALICHSEEWGEIRVSPGIMTHAQRRALFIHQPIGLTIHWRSFGYGTKDKPRFPRFYGIRCEGDGDCKEI